MEEKFMFERFKSRVKYEIKESVGPLGIRHYQALMRKCKKMEIMKRSLQNRGAVGGPMRSHVEIELYSYR